MRLPVFDTTRGVHRTKIQWCDYAVGSPFVFWDKDTGEIIKNACVKVSPGCANCYAEAIGLRFKTGRPYQKREMDKLECLLDGGVLRSMLNFRPKAPYKNGRDRPTVFLGDMTDVFGEWVPFELVDRVFASMALRPDVDWLILTKRPERMAGYTSDHRVAARLWDNLVESNDEVVGMTRQTLDTSLIDHGCVTWPLPNVWLGCSVEDQKRADERIPHLLRCPSHVRFLSCEPLIGPVLFTLSNTAQTREYDTLRGVEREFNPTYHRPPAAPLLLRANGGQSKIDWVIVGGESGSGARPCDVAWIRSIVTQCRGAHVPCFVKQMGSNPVSTFDEWNDGVLVGDVMHWKLRDRMGGEPEEWPVDLRVREVP